MAKILAVPMESGVPPRVISDRLRSQIMYFVSADGNEGEAPLGDNEYWFAPDEVAKWLDEGVFYVVSPLDTAHQTEVELTEEQEDFLGWLQAQGVRRLRIEW